MSAKTKIVVFKMKELIYTAVFVGLGILLIILLVYMFFPKQDSSKTSVTPTVSNIESGLEYIPGVYTASMVLNGQNIDISVTVDSNHINAINLVNLNDTITTMFPLIEPSLEELSTQICNNQSLEGVTYSDSSKFTSEAILKTIKNALKKAEAVE